MTASELFKKLTLKLIKENYYVDSLVSLASTVERLTHKDDINELMAQFHNFAGQYPFIDDMDFGALVLEVTATNLEDLNLKKRLIKEAIYRASWCAQSATSGSEGACRAKQLYRLKEYLNSLQSL